MQGVANKVQMCLIKVLEECATGGQVVRLGHNAAAGICQPITHAASRFGFKQS
jgi:hypothetical protein